MKLRYKILLILLVVLIVDFAYGQGCSQCKLVSKHAADGTLDEDTYSSNINPAILYLMAVPYILLIVFFRKKIISGFKNLIGK